MKDDNFEVLFSGLHDWSTFPKLDEGLSIDKLRELSKMLEPPIFNIKPLDDFVARGGNMDNLYMVTSNQEFKDITQLHTQHGVLKVQYTPFVPKDTVYFMNPPQTDDWFKPRF